MQASKIRSEGGPPAGRVGAGPERPPTGPAEAHRPDRRPFRAVLRRQPGPGADGEAAAEPALPRTPANEPARELLPREPTLIEHRPVARPVAPLIARVLLGQGAWSREARLELRGGVLAGAAIHLVSREGGVEVRVGAPSEPARAALAAVIDHVGLQLRSRGIVMRAGRALENGSKEGGRGGQPRRGT